LDTQGILYTGTQLSLFKALHHYIKRHHTQNLLIDPTVITRNLLIAELDVLDSSVEAKTASLKPKEENVPKLTRDTRWRTYKALFTNFLDGVIGKKGIPLSYVIRPIVIPPTLAHEPIYTTSHDGNAFKEDNNTVFRYLYGVVLGDQYEVYVKNFVSTRNGRAAYLALEDYFNGGAYQIHKVNTAWRIIQETKYTGKKSAMDFSVYRSTFDEAWADLREGGQEPNPQSKVRWLLDGMQEEDLKVAKDTITNDEKSIINYELTCLKLSRLISTDDTLDKGIKARQVSQVDARSREYQNDFEHIPYDQWNKLIQGNQRIPQEEWNKLSLSTKRRVLKHRKDNSDKNDNHNKASRGRGNINHYGRGGRDYYQPSQKQSNNEPDMNLHRQQKINIPTTGRGGRPFFNASRKQRGARKISQINTESTYNEYDHDHNTYYDAQDYY